MLPHKSSRFHHTSDQYSGSLCNYFFSFKQFSSESHSFQVYYPAISSAQLIFLLWLFTLKIFCLPSLFEQQPSLVFFFNFRVSLSNYSEKILKKKYSFACSCGPSVLSTHFLMRAIIILFPPKNFGSNQNCSISSVKLIADQKNMDQSPLIKTNYFFVQKLFSFIYFLKGSLIFVFELLLVSRRNFLNF